jgi:cell division protein FtsQ
LLKGLRSGNLFSKRADSVLDAPPQDRVTTRRMGEKVPRRSATVTEMPLRRPPASVEEFSDPAFADREDDVIHRPRGAGVRVSFTGGLVPRTLWGRIAAGGGLLVLIGGSIAAVLAVRSFINHDPHFVVESSSSVEIAGNSHLSHAQLLSVFGEDVERNIFRIPLDDRRAELESLPWVQHATVMRLLPDRVRVSIVERSPIAFVRQGHQMGLVDGNGVLLDFGTGDNAASPASKYSFPVVLGISQSDPLSTRAARMHLYQEFLAALDANGENLSHTLSEIDISEPEDVRAMVPDGTGGELLVHFGQERYLERYHRYQEHLAEWKQQYPHLASVDLRYEQQAVLQMQPGTSADTPSTPAAPKDGTPAPRPEAKAPAPRTVLANRKPLVAAAHPHSQSTASSSAKPPHHLTAYAAGSTRTTGKAPGNHSGAGTAR